MRPVVRFILPDGTRRELGPGDLVGRMPSAALALNEPTLSEAHAMVSLRGSQLKLLALRGRLSVAGKPLAEVALRPGLRVVLSSRVPLVVEAVSLPVSVLAVEGDTLPRRIVSSVVALHLTPRPELRPGLDPDAAALLWVAQDNLYVRRAGLDDAAFAAGDAFVVNEVTLRVVSVPLESAGEISTLTQARDLPALTLRVRYDTVHIDVASTRADTSEVTTHILDGILARIVSELALIGGPVDWEIVAREIWERDADNAVLRERWDASLGRLRKKLRSAGIRDDLVRANRSGQVELLLLARDRVEDLA